jgi:aspartate-semialdehyde dehydrogenase
MPSCHPLQGAIIANPNCSTIIALMAVTPLHRVATVKRMVVSTYQAASGTCCFNCPAASSRAQGAGP